MFIHCYGVIPLRGKEVFLVRHQKGHWAFPKGHADDGEEPLQTALRELKEETGLAIKQLLEPTFVERYDYEESGALYHKTVTYFLAEVEGEPTLQEAEIAEGQWLSLEDAKKVATYPETQKVCQELMKFLS